MLYGTAYETAAALALYAKSDAEQHKLFGGNRAPSPPIPYKSTQNRVRFVEGGELPPDEPTKPGNHL